VDEQEQDGEVAALIDAFENIRSDMLRLEEDSGDLLQHVHAQHQQSARNLLHYLALRSHDLRALQARLTSMGLSSLGRAESHVLASVESVLQVLQRLSRPRRRVTFGHAKRIDQADGRRLLESHTEALFGRRSSERRVAIMVTMPSEAASDNMLVSRLLEQGMDCMRINCAHDGPDQWARMVGHLRQAVARTKRPCRILMDLAGPKIRTSDLEPGPAVVKFRPKRDAYGRVLEPARVWLYATEQPRPSPTPADSSLPVPGSWLRSLQRDDVIRFVDTTGASRSLRVVAVDGDGCWLESRKTCYVQPGTLLRVDRATASEDATGREAKVGALPAREMPIALMLGDELIVTRSMIAGRNAVRDEHGRVLTPASIGCTADQVFADVQVGDQILFDDGKIGGVVRGREVDRLRVRIVRASAKGARLRNEKGINLPDTDLRLPAMTNKDRSDLTFVCQHADMVALSFVNSTDDVRELRSALAPLGEAQPAIVLKIETRRGFQHLPEMLLEAMQAPRCAVMIARGDLAVECGFERLAEVQEEILWVCEAAHVPVIWATQVLETLAKEGIPSRAEVTDAAMSNRAECVMLNKGPYVVQAVQVLDDILRRMHGHQSKKRSMLRELRLVASFRQARASTRAPGNGPAHKEDATRGLKRDSSHTRR
jgi:pyruvate kinase